MKPVQVMIVEDEALVGIDIQENLLNYGYQVVGISNSGESAVENAIKSKPEVILMDIHLSGKMNGIEAAHKIRQNLGIPIIYLTAFSDDKTLKKALETSPSGYLLKPFVPRELHTSIQTALNKEEKNKDIKLARLRYIQSNILEKKNLKLELENIQKANKYLPQRSYSRIIERLNYIADTIRKKGNTESKLKEQIQNSNKLERLLGDIVFYQNITNESAYILPIAEFAALLEYNKEDVSKMGSLIIPLLIHPEDYKIMDSYFGDLTSKSGIVSEIEIRLKHKSGIWRYISCRGIYNESEKGLGTIVHSVKDITWLKNQQYISHISREKFIAVSNNPYFGIAILDTDAKIMTLNPTLEHLTGYTKEDLNWLNVSDYIGMKELRYICQNFEKLIVSKQRHSFIQNIEVHFGVTWYLTRFIHQIELLIVLSVR